MSDNSNIGSAEVHLETNATARTFPGVECGSIFMATDGCLYTKVQKLWKKDPKRKCFNWYTSYCAEEDLSDYTGEVPAGAETFQKLASIRYDKRELTSNRMTYNVSFVEENSVYKIVDLLNNPKDDYRHYLWLHSSNYFGYNYNVSLY